MFKREGEFTMLSCPNCGGNLRFDIPSQQLSCEHCQTLFDPYAFDEKTEDAGETTVTVYTCPQCGGEIISTDNAATGFCSFCGASTIFYNRISHEKRPDYILPFQLTKEQCKQSYARRMKHALFAPKELKNPAFIDGFRGIYMPYWAYYITEQGNISVNGKRNHRSGDYIITDHYAISGDLDAYYKGISYDASSSFADSISAALAPYDLREMKAFTPAYLSGFYADTADVDAAVYQPQAEQTAAAETISRLEERSPFRDYTLDTIAPDQLHTQTKEVDYAMLPVWFLSYRNKDRVAYATVNGQTGKIVADIPIDPRRYLAGSLLLSVPIFLFLFLFVFLLPATLLGICCILSVAALFVYTYEYVKIWQKNTAGTSAGTPREKLHPAGWILPLCSFGMTVFILNVNPVFDIFYYIGVLFSMGAILATFILIIRAYNILATRRLPQFDRTGGDDRA